MFGDLVVLSGEVGHEAVVPIQTILLSGRKEYVMFPDLRRRYPWVLEPYRYDSEETLIASLNERVISPAEAKVVELRQK
jgi:hypothetical protein